MQEKTFKFIKEDELDDEPILGVIFEIDVQNCAEAYGFGELNDIQLYRVKIALHENEEAFMHIHEAIRTAVEDALDEKTMIGRRSTQCRHQTAKSKEKPCFEGSLITSKRPS